MNMINDKKLTFIKAHTRYINPELITYKVQKMLISMQTYDFFKEKYCYFHVNKMWIESNYIFPYHDHNV